MGLDGLLRARAPVLHGILNGIDDAVWNPAADPLIVADFSVQPAGGTCRRQDLRAGVVRPGGGTGSAAVRRGQPADLAEGARSAALRPRRAVAAGRAACRGRQRASVALEAGFTAAAAAHPGRIGCVIGYDEALAHQIQAGADALLVPSRFEPCGLTQLCALRYGALPVVARVGGLADTVIDANEAALGAGTGSGVQFAPVSREMLEAATAPHRGAVAAARRCGGGCSTTRCAPTSPGGGRRPATRRCFVRWSPNGRCEERRRRTSTAVYPQTNCLPCRGTREAGTKRLRSAGARDAFAPRARQHLTGSPGNRRSRAPCGRSAGGCAGCRPR